jgi:hypothetical protein
LEDLLVSLEREGKLQVVCFKQGAVGKDFPGYSISDDHTFADHNAAMTDIQNQVKIV